MNKHIPLRTDRLRPSGLARWTRRMLTALLGLLALVALPAHAGVCTYLPGTPTFFTAVSNIVGSVTVGRDVPVGAVIYQATFHGTSPEGVTCTAGTYTSTRRYVSLPHPLSSYVDPKYGNRVYETSVPGIGAVVWYSGNAFPYTFGPYTTTNTTNVGTAAAFDISLIKIGPVGAGTIRGSDLPTFEYVQFGDNTLRMELGSFSGAINIVSRTCTTPDVTVNMGTHYTKELTGIGSSTDKWIDVPISLNNCPAFFGAFRGAITDNNGVAERSTPNQISNRVDPVTSVVNPAQGVMALQPDGVNPTAQGIGIQLVDAGDNPVSYGNMRASGLALNQVDGSSYTISLKARYYQTEATTAAGQANGAATVTLIYN
jgi:type 1 fimbria pilin